MTTTVEALSWIAEHSTAHNENLLTALKFPLAPGAVPVVALPDDLTLHNLEKFLPAPSRFKGIFCTNYIHQFVAYWAAQGGAVTFVNSEAMSAKSVFDLGDKEHPGHGEHAATLKLETTAPYDAMLKLHGSTFTQRGLAEWLEQWRGYLVPMASVHDAPESMGVEIAAAIAAVKTIDIKETFNKGASVGNFSADKSTLEQIEITSKLVLPVAFVFECEPYAELKTRRFIFRLTITNSDQPKLTLQPINHEIIVEAMALEFADRLAADLRETNALAEDELKIYIGTWAGK